MAASPKFLHSFAEKGSAPHFAIPEFSGVFRGRELTPKNRHLSSGLLPLDHFLEGGLVRGRISEIVGASGTGRTSLAASIMAAATSGGEVAAWLDSTDSFDPATIVAAGVRLERVLWVAVSDKRPDSYGDQNDFFNFTDPDPYVHKWNSAAFKRKRHRALSTIAKAAELLMAAGGFGLLVMDLGKNQAFSQATALRLARAAESNGTAVLIMAAHRMCGTFAALSLQLKHRRACFSRSGRNAPVLFDGLELEARITRNKLGGSGGTLVWKAVADLNSAPLKWKAEAAARPQFGHDTSWPKAAN